MTRSDDVPERDLISRRLRELTSESLRLSERMKKLAQEDYGLVSGVTRVRKGDMVGTFAWVLNYETPGPPSIRVNLDADREGGRQRGMNFYDEWEEIPPSQD
ncbi:MAG: hypothetical protein B7Z02_04375 [Rhodobacterales bacterium 32-67-9]|nr:MAG: hypothetical protein B7Z02_04375 [Rhodobacterales bacterium 32-67-9]